EEFLEGLNHLFIDIVRLSDEPDYREKRGGYCDVQVKTLDREIPSACKLVAAKKLFLSARSHDPKRLAFRLARELKVWAGLRHTHVLPLVGFYVGDNYDSAVLISEYMVHGDLKDYIVKMKPSYDERLYLVRDLTDGLAYLHTQSVRHGDLKPGNVLVNPQRRALLADFGLSKALDTGPTGFTTGNDVRGTVRFSSPEVMLQDAAAQMLENDIWSWGCLVLEAMTDKAPFADIQAEPYLMLALVQGRSPCVAENLALDLPQFTDLLNVISPLVLELFEHHTPWEFSATPEEPFDQNRLWASDLFPEDLPEQDPSWGFTAAPLEAFDINEFWASDLFPEELSEQHPPSGLGAAPEELSEQHSSWGFAASPSEAFEQHSPGEQPPTRSPTPQPSQTPQASPQATQPPQTDLSNGSSRFYTYFMTKFSSWLEQRQPSLDPQVDEKKAELPELFLVVGAVGGWRAVSEKMLWPAVSAKIGFLSFVGPVLHSKPKEAELLSEVYENLLAEFEVHWHTSLKPHDPGSIFPLPPQLQHLHPEIEKLAASLILLRQQQEQFPRSVEAGSRPPVPPGSPPEPSASSSHPSPRTSQIGLPQGLRGHLQEQGQLPPPPGGPPNAPSSGGNETLDGMAPHQTPIMAAAQQFMHAGRPGNRSGTPGSQVGGGSQPSAGISPSRARGPPMPPSMQPRPGSQMGRLQQPGPQGSPFTGPMPGPPSGFPISPQMMEQAMRTLGYHGKTQDSLNPDERNNLQNILRTVQRAPGMGTPRMAPGANLMMPGAPQPGPSRPQGGMPGSRFPQYPRSQQMKRPRSPFMQRDIPANESSPPDRKRLRKDSQNGSTPTIPGVTPGAPGVNGQQQPPVLDGAAKSSMMRPTPGAPVHSGQMVNPVMMNRAPHGPGANIVGPRSKGPGSLVSNSTAARSEVATPSIASSSRRSSFGIMSSRPDPLALGRMLAAAKPEHALDEEAVAVNNAYGDLAFDVNMSMMNISFNGPTYGSMSMSGFDDTLGLGMDTMIMPPVQDVGLGDDQPPLTATTATWRGATTANGYDINPTSTNSSPSHPHTRHRPPAPNPATPATAQNPNLGTYIFNPMIAPSPFSILSQVNMNQSTPPNNASGPGSSVNPLSAATATAGFNFLGPEMYAGADFSLLEYGLGSGLPKAEGASTTEEDFLS
ncbi:hypothetical protein FRC01_004392, partial [Tulasnella sp. 417]